MLNEAAKDTLGICIGVALSNSAWKFFGFKRCPKHGAIFQYFRQKWRVNLEKGLLGEFIITNISIYILGGKLHINDVDEVAHYLIEEGRLGDLLGYSHEKDLKEAILIYVHSSVYEWSNILAKRLKINIIEDKQVMAGIIHGCAQFSRVAAGMIDHLRKTNVVRSCNDTL